MAVVALNTFKTIRAKLTTTPSDIYTCPIGVATIILLAQVTNVSVDNNTYTVTAIHSRGSESPSDYKFANDFMVPANDSSNLVPDGKLVLETGDKIYVSASADDKIELILSVLETAKQ